jgi:hypothetical protein
VDFFTGISIKKYRKKQKAKGNKVLQVIISKESVEMIEALKRVLAKNQNYTNGEIIDFSLFLSKMALDECENNFLIKVLSEYKKIYNKN